MRWNLIRLEFPVSKQCRFEKKIKLQCRQNDFPLIIHICPLYLFLISFNNNCELMWNAMNSKCLKLIIKTLILKLRRLKNHSSFHRFRIPVAMWILSSLIVLICLAIFRTENRLPILEILTFKEN